MWVLWLSAAFATPRAMPEATEGPGVMVYGYQAYWAADLDAVPWDELSHLALFAASADASGNLSGTSNWDDAATAVAMAAPYGVRVHLCVTNFDPDSIGAFLASESARATLIATLRREMDETGAHGVNIDFEGLPAERRDDMVAFVRDLEAEVGEVVLATPAVDWSDAWDYYNLSAHADLFIMGYGYHWSGSGSAGPTDPLHGGGVWSDYALDWTIADYLAEGADPQRVILGLPLYGYVWPTVDGTLGADTTGDGDAIFWAEAHDEAARWGAQWDATTLSPWYWDGASQGWYSDVDSLRARIRYGLDAGLGGIGFWALHYDEGDPELWSMVAEETAPLMPAPTSSFVASAGEPLLAYVGDTIILSAAGSTGPEGVDLEYRWTQTSGPAATLDDATAMEPRFVVEAPGVHVFELIVGDGASFSAPDHSYIVVLDEAAGTRHGEGGGGCDTTGGVLVGWAAALGLLAVRRRR